MELAELQRETRSSIEVERTAKSDYKWTIKIYMENGQHDDALAAIKDIDTKLRAEYLPKGE